MDDKKCILTTDEDMEKDIISVFPQDGGELKRNSIGETLKGPSLTPSSGEEKLVPHYLRASTGSCHDYCKYGRKHMFEAKERRPISHKVMGDTVSISKNEKEIKNVNHEGRKKKLIIKLKVTTDLKTEFSNKPKITKKASSPTKKIEIFDKHVIALKLRPAAAKSADLKTELSDKPNIPNRNASSPAKIIEVSDKHATASKLTPVAAKSPSPSPSRGLSSRRKSTDCTTNSLGGLKSQVNSEPSSDLSGGLGRRTNRHDKILPNFWKLGEKKVLKPPIVMSLSPRASVNRIPSSKSMKYRNVKLASTAMNRNKARKSEPIVEEVREKTLYVIEPKLEKKTIKPIQHRSHNNQSHRRSLLSPLLPASSPSCSQDEKGHRKPDSMLNKARRSDTEKKQGELSKSGSRRMSKRVVMVRSEDKECVQEKLRFRRGKVVNVESENNTPRRLRFRQGRVLGENSKGEAGRRSFRRMKEFGGGDSNSPNHSQTVVLRHQDVQGKKEEQGLFNDVIEETANKLVETRKSKVKALVGAFETVILLQERKPAAIITATTNAPV